MYLEFKEEDYEHPRYRVYHLIKTFLDDLLKYMYRRQYYHTHRNLM